MGKTYIDTLKYVIYANVKINGLVEKPDVVGAIFGQTEGLLGEELDLRELQKNGRIGRIHVNLEEKKGMTTGEIRVPSSLDMVETCIIAGALETVDRVGPCDAKISVQKVEDTRDVKRKAIIERAKQLLKMLHETEIPESREITNLVRDEVRIAEISTFGPEKLPSGPNIGREDSIIIVEGRADVINMLKSSINNVVSLGGASRVPKSVVDLSHTKEITVFLDGDRGGDLILKQLLAAKADIDFVARAPDGKEVEELARKEIIKAIRNKLPLEQYLAIHSIQPIELEEEHTKSSSQKRNKIKKDVKRRIVQRVRTQKQERRNTQSRTIPKDNTELRYDDIMNMLNKLENTLKTQFYDKKHNLIKEVPVRDMLKELEKTDNIDMIVFDGIVTQRLVDLASEKGVKMIIGIKMGNVFKKPDTLRVITKP
ncbi:DNA primase [Candidatus Micrarchaeota archaeon]|nr:DNA primase [Candidatus Micrarchaeota archaeon]